MLYLKLKHNHSQISVQFRNNFLYSALFVSAINITVLGRRLSEGSTTQFEDYRCENLAATLKCEAKSSYLSSPLDTGKEEQIRV